MLAMSSCSADNEIYETTGNVTMTEHTEPEVNRIITSRIEDIEDESLRQFIDGIVTHERAKLDRNTPHYKETYETLLEGATVGGDGDAE
jgi:hypothetical protein